MPHPRLAHDTKTPDPQTSHEDKLRPQRQSLENIRPTSDAGVVHNVRLVAHSLNDLLQRIQRRNGSVDLPTGVVGHHDAITSEIDALLRVLHTLNPLDTERLAAADPLPRLHQPRHPVPALGAAVPDVVDPERTGTLRVLLRIDALLREPFPKDRVGEPQIGADAAVEGVVAGRDVVVAPAELPGVGGEDAGGEAGLVGAFQERDGQFVVVGHVELKETRPCAVGSCDVFDRGRTGGAEAVGEVKFFGDGRNGELAVRVVDFVDADWCEAYRGGDFVPEDCGGGVAEVGVDELAGDDAMPEEGLAGIGGCIQPFT